MQKISTMRVTKSEIFNGRQLTIGLDLGDRFSSARSHHKATRWDVVRGQAFAMSINWFSETVLSKCLSTTTSQDR